MKSAWDTFMGYLDGRAKTRVYALFVLWILIFHIQIIFFAIFVDQQLVFQKYNLLKNEYIAEYLMNPSDVGFWIFEIIKITAAFAITYLIIWKLPDLITKRAYDRELNDEYDLKFKKLTKENELAKKKNDVAKKELDTIMAVSTVQNEQLKIEKTEEQEWTDEYDSFKHSPLFTDFKDIIESVYENYGKIRVTDYSNNVIFSVDTDMLAYANSNNLVDFDQKDARISLTQKGKFFVRMYQIS